MTTPDHPVSLLHSSLEPTGDHAEAIRLLSEARKLMETMSIVDGRGSRLTLADPFRQLFEAATSSIVHEYRRGLR